MSVPHRDSWPPGACLHSQMLVSNPVPRINVQFRSALIVLTEAESQLEQSHF